VFSKTVFSIARYCIFASFLYSNRQVHRDSLIILYLSHREPQVFKRRRVSANPDSLSALLDPLYPSISFDFSFYIMQENHFYDEEMLRLVL
jgi:hypothetical protein